MAWYGTRSIPVELNEPHHWGMRDAPDVVFVVAQNTVERRAIQTGGTDGDRLEVTAGLSSGERVVVSPPATLAPGTPIVIKQ